MTRLAWTRVGHVVGVGLLAGLLSGCLGSRDPGDLPPVPDPATNDMPRAVVELLEKARLEVLEQPRSSQAWGRLGAVCDAHHLFEEAAVCYRAAHRLSPTEFRWAYLLAVIQDFRGADPAEVVALFDRATELNPEYPPTQLRFGQALVRLGNLTRARDAYRRAIELDDDFALAHRGLGQVLLAMNHPEDALRHLLRAAELTPDDGIVHAGLARVYQALGRAEEAHEEAKRATLLEPRLGVPDPLRYEVELLARVGRS